MYLYLWRATNDLVGKRIDKKLVAYSGFRSMDMMSDHAIDKTLVVPSGATGFSFSFYTQEYNGRD